MFKKQVRNEFNIELLGYKKSEVDELVNALSERLEVLAKDVHFLKCELKRVCDKDEKLLKPAQK